MTQDEHELNRLIGRIEATLIANKDTLEKNTLKLTEIEVRMNRLENTLEQAKGGWKLIIGGAAVISFVIGTLTYVFQHFRII